MEKLKFCEYDDENDIHIIDYSGKIDLQTGLSRIENLKKYFNAFKKSGKKLKVLMDARKYQKHSPETHNKLSKIARSIFYKELQVKLAVLDANYESSLSDNEAWFTDMPTAINWLNK